MVIFGGLELVAAGYIIHKHSKNKKEKRRLEDEAADLEEEEDRLEAQKYSHRRRRRSDEYDRRQEYSHDRKDGRRPHREPQPQYLDVNAPQPARSHSAPPQEQYPPTGWPAHWEQSQRPPTNTAPAQSKSSSYNYPPNRQPAQGSHPGGQPSSMRPVSPSGRHGGRYSNEALGAQGTGQSGRNKHVRLVVPGEEVDRGDRYDPPPQYRE